MSENEPRSIVFGRRKGHRLSPRQRSLLENLLPTLSISPPDEADFATRLSETRSGYAGLWLEIGFGKGEQLAAMAAEHDDVLFIGCEPYINGIASLLGKIEDSGLKNILIYPGDAADILDKMPEAAIERAFVIHPDPWPKRRHWKRRFINPRTVAALARTIADNGTLHIASDDASYLTWTLMHLGHQPALEWTAESAQDWRRRPAGWPLTRYARKAETEGRKSIYLNFRRRPRADPAQTA